MSYQELTSLPAGSSGNANEKMGPKGLPRSAFGNSTAPDATIIQERPHSVICNPVGTSLGTSAEYLFLFETTASIGGTSTGETYTTGSVVRVGNGQTELMIQPVAWDIVGGSGAKGDVIFVYRGGL